MEAQVRLGEQICCLLMRGREDQPAEGMALQRCKDMSHVVLFSMIRTSVRTLCIMLGGSIVENEAVH